MFFKDMLTRSELRMLKRRWHIANLILLGFDMRQIAKDSKTSTQTVSKIKHVLEEGQGGLRLALERSFEKQKRDNKKRESSYSRGGSKYVKGWLKWP